MSLSAGDKLGPYGILAQIGAGGMGELYRARDRKLNRDVAIEVVPAALPNDAQYMARGGREAQVLASLHPSIATVCRIPLTIQEAIPIAKQTAAGLQAAHQRGIVHRDGKPANSQLKLKRRAP